MRFAITTVGGLIALVTPDPAHAQDHLNPSPWATQSKVSIDLWAAADRSAR
jgi:hypothetical protein